MVLMTIGFVESRDSSSGFEMSSTREEILATRAKRKEQLEGLLLETKQQLTDHNSGKRLLDAKDLAGVQKKIHVYERKLETMEGDMDEREVERILKREELRFQRDEERRRRREREEL